MHDVLKFTFAFALPILLGCSGPADPLNRQAVTGSITFQGKPLDQGAISFETHDPAHGTNSGAMIEQGRFSIAQRRGLPPGVYTVRISSPDVNALTLTDGEAPGETSRLPQERIPAAWNTKSQQTITIEADSQNHFDLDIP